MGGALRDIQKTAAKETSFPFEQIYVSIVSNKTMLCRSTESYRPELNFNLLPTLQLNKIFMSY